MRLVDSLLLQILILYQTDTSEVLPTERLGVDNRQLESTEVFSLALREPK